MKRTKMKICCLLLALAVSLDIAYGHKIEERFSRHTRSMEKLRHSKHLMTRSSNSNPSDLSGSSYKPPTAQWLQIQDNHKPQFVNCSNYAPSVQEEQQVGTYVFQVHAQDFDPKENGGNLTYSFISSPGERLKFSIEPDTGIIRTLQMLDRDEPSREREVHLIAKVTDNGHPPLVEVCHFKVTITDINDNAPVFDKANYVDYVPQDLKVGTEVMRISATDIDDGKNSIINYSLEAKSPQDIGFFRIENSGIILLDKFIDRAVDYKFNMLARATDGGHPPLSSTVNLEIFVVASNKKAPSFVDPRTFISLNEDYKDYSTPIVNLTAHSNIDNDPEVQFELVTGRTLQTNKMNTFVLLSEKNNAWIKLGGYMDYENVVEYVLTVRATNRYNLAAETQIVVEVKDVNDNIPAFTELISGSVLENDPPGTPVMQVRALDADGTSQHNQVTYELADHTDIFAIDPHTGNITTRKQFDREEKDFYNIKVIAKDNSISAFSPEGGPNKGEQVFRIEIADRNDNAPRFTQKVYRATGVREDSNTNSPVAEVKAVDSDTSSIISYRIIAGNTFEAFDIEKTGKITIKNPLDYETITSYNLTVEAFDGRYSDTAYVEIEVENVNDNPPVFNDFIRNITIEEESLVPGCLTVVTAYDPDITDRSAPQNINFFVVEENWWQFFEISDKGCFKLQKPLDRDQPNGFPIWQVHIAAVDEGGKGSKTVTEIDITLIDINDNAPFLDMIQPVYWMENKPPGTVASLSAKDVDSDVNGPPFTFVLDKAAPPEVTENFYISGTGLETLQKLDREHIKTYAIPIVISDSGSPRMSGTSTLTLIVADENDNEMKPGQSSIFVYNYKGEAPDTQIGRVYVEDPDDWDLPDKTFTWRGGAHPNFALNANTGMITMNEGTGNGSYLLEFEVTEESQYIDRHSVDATVNVTVKPIPEEAVDKSGSIRFAGVTDKEFITPNALGVSKRDILQMQLVKLYNTSIDNVDVFTVLVPARSPNTTTYLDVRFSAHGSPYYPAGKLNYMAGLHQDKLERDLGLEIVMISIDECLLEKENDKGQPACPNSSCMNFLKKKNIPYAIYTNTTSFVGVEAVVEPLCSCKTRGPHFCLNGGTPLDERCVCLEGFHGPRCELTSIGFGGDGWALFPPLSACDESRLSLDIRADRPDGLIFYVGPMRSVPTLGVTDFMALEVRGGYPSVLMDYGSGTVRGNHTEIKINDGNVHHIDIIWNIASIELQVDNCRKSSCMTLLAPGSPNKYLNVNGPLQLGGPAVDLTSIARTFGWSHIPISSGFAGCISNFTFNGKMFNVGQPELSKNVDLGCNRGLATAYSFGIDTNFIVAILVCIAILLILLLAVVVHRRKTDDMYKDQDDIRENIINYEDEGGGEGDMTGYDLGLLRVYPQGEKIPLKERSLMSAPSADDIGAFLDAKSNKVDNDPDCQPFDDVRHYAYEGDGDSRGSLSSLASGTDEEDLDFDYLSSFGPRFRKLADMYGEPPSDNESDAYANTGGGGGSGGGGPAPESWC